MTKERHHHTHNHDKFSDDRQSPRGSPFVPIRTHALGQPPLIDRVTNEWQYNEKYLAHDSDGDSNYSEDSEPPFKNWRVPAWISWRSSSSRRAQRYLLIYILFLLGSWFTWSWVVLPAFHEHHKFDMSFDASHQSGAHLMGTNMVPSFSKMIQTQKLDPKYLPSRDHPDRRLILVGDVHGCKEELEHLLKKVNFHQKRDHLILTGDVLSKGPDSRGVIDLAREVGASSVRGNHEDRILLAYEEMRRKNVKLADSPAETAESDSEEDDVEEERHFTSRKKDRKLVKKLHRRHFEWLQQCPVILDVGQVPGFGPEKHQDAEIIVVHAGLMPLVPLERQDPFLVMNMRSIDLATRIPSEERHLHKGSVPWERVWDHAMRKIHHKDQRVVVYGHDSKTGLNIRKWSKGIDSGCVNGGHLSALVIGNGGGEEVVQVKCKGYA
ncbi:Metallo-dependent phosphatase [Aulographum hederae CBS 113979]|uniref:Metallo-dependent phosphatase n=1 Tax=Aulographum hederae CBS 113979 TaxID=1176131 RepID=A0A6G1HCY6_9PEZI|nr:Metallo-dependent phosphatase [Aulographum hederae CBS 113979]